MPTEIRVTLFGRFCVQLRGEPLLAHAPHKVQELLAYLLLNPGKPHPREALADLLWEECESPHAKKYLRQALWQLEAGLAAVGRTRTSRLVHREPGWVELDLAGCASVDTVKLEEAFHLVRGRNGISSAVAQTLTDAIQLYRGDLLEGWNVGWCAYERDRLREMYLAMLDRLVAYYESHGSYEAGIAFSTLALQRDRARERTHRHLMRLKYLSGDRTGALRQYERCAAALREELAVTPSRETEGLYRTICHGGDIARNGNAASPAEVAASPSRGGPVSLVLPSRNGARRYGAPAPETP